MVLLSMKLFPRKGAKLIRRIDIIRQIPIPTDLIQIGNDIFYGFQILTGQMQTEGCPLPAGKFQHLFQHPASPAAAPIPKRQIEGIGRRMRIAHYRHIVHNCIFHRITLFPQEQAGKGGIAVLPIGFIKVRLQNILIFQSYGLKCQGSVNVENPSSFLINCFLSRQTIYYPRF